MQNNATEEYVVEKLANYVMNSVEEHYSIKDIKKSMHKILMNYSNVLNALKRQDKSFVDFNVFGNLINEDIVLTTQIKLKVSGKENNYHFSCVIESKPRGALSILDK